MHLFAPPNSSVLEPEGITRALDDRDMHLTLARISDERLSDPEYTPRLLRELHVDGLLVNYRYGIPSRMVELIETHHMPAVWIGAPRDHDCVFPCDREAARQLTQGMLDLGHRRVAYIDRRDKDFHAKRPARVAREAGYIQAMRHAGATHYIIEDKHSDDISQLRASLAEGRPTAVVCLDQRLAERAWFAAQQLAWEVPADLSIATFHYGTPQMGLVRFRGAVTPHGQVGAHAVEMLMQKIAAPKHDIPPLMVQHRMVDGETACPPRSMNEERRQ